MRIELYQQAPWPPGFTVKDIRPTLERVAEGFDTTHLVVTLGLTDGTRWRGTYHPQLTPAAWPHIKDVGKTPADLPARFPCITMLFGTGERYPCRHRPDCYGWHWDFGVFRDQLAATFAHECFHAMEGPDWRDEQAANRWALAHVQSLGYRVEAEPPQGAADG
jgi:hypothetical protein